MKPSRVFCLLLLIAGPAHGQQTLRVMTFNIWHDGKAGGQPIQQTAEVIKAAGADVVGLQEASASVPAIAKLLGWNYVSTAQQTGRGTAVLSRYPLKYDPSAGVGVRIGMENGDAWIFDVHFSAAPYQPYQLLKIPYHDARFISTAEEAVTEAETARGAEVKSLVQAIQRLTSEEDHVFVTGDFNEPSHLDWTQRATQAKRHPIAVRYPATLQLQSLGFTDGYRSQYPDEVRHPGFTWTPLTAANDVSDHHDRIDYVFGRGPGLKVNEVQVVGEAAKTSSVVVDPFPSDHRAVVVEFAWDEPERKASPSE